MGGVTGRAGNLPDGIRRQTGPGFAGVQEMCYGSGFMTFGASQLLRPYCGYRAMRAASPFDGSGRFRPTVTIRTNFGMKIHYRSNRMRDLISRAVAGFALDVAHLLHAQGVGAVEKVIESAIRQLRIPAGGVARQAISTPLKPGMVVVCQGVAGVTPMRVLIRWLGARGMTGLAMGVSSVDTSVIGLCKA